MCHPISFLKGIVVIAIVFSRSAHSDEPVRDAAELNAADANQAEMANELNKKKVEVLNLQEVKPARRVTIKARPAVIRAVINVGPQNDARVQQYLQQLHPVMTSELGLVRQTCEDLPIEQRSKVYAAVEAELKTIATKAANGQLRAVNLPLGEIVAGRMASNATGLTPCYVREEIAKVLKEHLSEDQHVRYSKEAAERTAGRKQAAIMNFVAHLDEQLFLSSEQRNKITDAISSEWQFAWEKWTIYNANYLPVVPDQFLLPHLTDSQKSVWQQLEKAEMEWWGAGQEVDQQWWGVPPGEDGDEVIRRPRRAMRIQPGF